MLQPLSTPLQDGVRFLPLLLPAALSERLAALLPVGEHGRATGLPRSAGMPAWVRSRLFAEGAASACGEFGAPQPDPVPFGPSLILKPPRGGHGRAVLQQHLWLVYHNGVYQRFIWVDRTTSS